MTPNESGIEWLNAAIKIATRERLSATKAKANASPGTDTTRLDGRIAAALKIEQDIRDIIAGIGGKQP